MSKEIPFDEDVMTLIMGLGGPEEPGQHGRKNVPSPDMDTIELITQIRDLCEEFLKKAGKEDTEDEKTSDEETETEDKDLGDEKPSRLKIEEE